MGRSGVVRLLTAGVLVAAGLVSSAQTRRIVTAIDSTQAATLPGNVAPRVLAAEDKGPAPADTVLTDMALRFSMTSSQQAALEQLLADQQNPASPRYHQWLTPEQFRAQFGLGADDIAKVTSWLSSQGFTVTEVSRGGTFVRFTGSVAQAQRAFATEIHSVTLHGEAHLANVTAPSLPRALAAVTTGISGLNDFRPHPHHVQSTVQAPELSGSAVAARPMFTSSVSGNTYIAPGDFYTIYGETGLLSSSINGTGITIAVMGQTDILLSDIAAFRSASGLSATAPTVKLYGTDPGMPSQDDLTEASLDVEWSGAAAPGATILYVNSTNAVDGSLTEAVDNNLAPIISISYGDCESDLGVSNLAFYSQLLQQASVQGITITAASGDSGATDCDYNSAVAAGGLAVDFPASSPLVTAVGGTEFNEGTGTYWSSTNGANSGSALSYIPEVVWNDDNSGGLYSSGGGSSLYFSKPVWQTGSGVPADSSRDVPDVALNASPAHDPYLICISGSCTSGYRNSAGTLQVVGGTSAGAPTFAGLLALVEQKTGSRLGNANPVIYALANSTYAGNVFHDVVAGTNASPCQSGTPSCTAGLEGYSATANYDLATGWGSVNAMNLATDWPLVTPVAVTVGARPSYTNVSGSANSVAAGTAVNLTATVISATTTLTPTPSGSVQFTVDNVAVGTPVALNASGVATYALSTTGLTSGSHTIQATYNGDTTYAGSKGAFALNITSASAADFTLSPGTATVTVKSGAAAQGLTLTVAAVNGFTGSVQFTATSSSSLNAEYSFSTNPVTLSATATSATTTLNLFAFTGNAKGATALVARNNAHAAWYGAGSGVAMASLLLLVLPRRKRRWMGALLAVLFAATLGISGCSSGSSLNGGGLTNNNTPPGTYSVQVQATGVVSGTSVSHTSTISFVVQ
ncbi:MAG TPA: protease pro-enzyme activation domain-containing protein [Acidobacteriaceae bacterium]|jgi:subtilase family serine protease